MRTTQSFAPHTQPTLSTDRGGQSIRPENEKKPSTASKNLNTMSLTKKTKPSFKDQRQKSSFLKIGPQTPTIDFHGMDESDMLANRLKFQMSAEHTTSCRMSNNKLQPKQREEGVQGQKSLRPQLTQPNQPKNDPSQAMTPASPPGQQPVGRFQQAERLTNQ